VEGVDTKFLEAFEISIAVDWELSTIWHVLPRTNVS
jgi:hypothetical protein